MSRTTGIHRAPRRSFASFLAYLVVFSFVIGQGGVMSAQAGGTLTSLPSSPAGLSTGGSGGDSHATAAGFGSALAPAASATLLTNSQADLQGWRPAPVTSWTQGNVCGAVPSGKCYRELDNVPHKIVFSGLTAGTTYYIEILNEYRDGASGPFGYDNLNRSLLPGFNDSNASGVTLTLLDNSTGCGSKICGHYRLEFTADAASGEVQFNAHLALGAHTWSGSNLSVQLNGSNETVTIPVNEIVVPITAHKFNDLNGNGIQDAGEPNLANWEMTLYKSDCSSKVSVPAGQTNPGLTDGNGNYTWAVQGSTAGSDGKWCVKETLQAGWVNTTGNLSGVVLAGGTATFGNKLLTPDLTIVKTADKAAVSAGDDIGFTIKVTNNGQGTAKGVTMTDSLPAGFTWHFDQVTGGWSCALNSGTLTCGGQAFDLAAGLSASVHVYAATGRADCGDVQNKASVTAGNNSTVQSNTVTVTIKCPDLAVTKTADKTPVDAGDPIGYTIKVTNNGTGTAKNVVLTDTLPTNAGLSWSIDPPVAGCSITLGVLTCNVGDLAAGASFSVHLSSPTTKATCGQVLNLASASADNNPSVDSNQSTIQVRCAAIQISKLADDTTVDAGDDIGFTITVENTGAGTAKGVTMTDTLPAGLVWDFDKVTGGWTCAINGGTLTCGDANFDLASGLSASVHIYATTDNTDCGVVSNTASVTTSNDGSGNATATVTVNCPNVTVVKDPDAGVIDAGDPAEFTITVTNEGPGTAKNVTLSDTLPGSIAWSEDSTFCSISGNLLTCNFGDLPAHAVRVVHVSGQTDFRDCGVLENTATVSADNEPSAAGGDNSDAAQITVNCPPIGIQIVKSGPTLAHVGDTITYTFDVSLTTPEPLFDVVVTDDRCDQGAPIFDSETNGNGDRVLEDGEVWHYTCTHKILGSDPDPLPNTATVNGTSDDGRNTSDTDDHSVDVIHPDIRIVKTVDPESGEPGDTVTYTFKVTNTGDTTLYDISVDDDVIGHIGDIAVLEPKASVSLTADYVLPESDIPVVNVGVAAGHDELGENVKDDDDASVTVVQAENPNPPKPPPPTAFTGSDAARMGLIAAALLALGLLALVAGRRRRDEHA